MAGTEVSEPIKIIFNADLGTIQSSLSQLQELFNKQTNQIERLREAGDWLWEAMSRHDNTRECPNVKT